MQIVETTQAYEAWLRSQTSLLPRDLRAKHKAMAEGAFPFLRATFYCWAQLWPRRCPDLTETPTVLGVGDLHVENFGTWLDSEGRLIWGVNDFDESHPMPYANDLVRLAASARLAIRENHLACDPEKACDAVLEGYKEAIGKRGSPLILAEHNRWLRTLALNKRRHPVAFWRKLEKAKASTKPVTMLRRALEEHLPGPVVGQRFVHRQAGVGSLGRHRYTLLGEWEGSRIAREAKPLVPSAWVWARNQSDDSKLWYHTILNQAVRVADPFLKVRERWVLRRLAPDCSRIELSHLPRQRDELRLLRAMGWETANIHLGSTKVVPRIRKDLQTRNKSWLRDAAERMEQATIADWKQWKRYWKRSRR
jgi:uncharacterized protein (DUF2252 family)